MIDIPRSSVEGFAEACGLRVRDAVNGHVGRERLRLERVSSVGDGSAVIVWSDSDGPSDCDLKCIWELADDCVEWERQLVDMIVDAPRGLS